MSDSTIPEGFPRITPSLAIRDAAAAMTWYARVFGAEEIARLADPDGNVVHGELRIGDSVVMLGEENAEWHNVGPGTLGGTSVRIHLYVDDVDAVFARALEAGAEELIPLADQFYGDRAGRIQDPFGHQWILASRVEDVPEDEMQRRFQAWFE